MPKFHDPQLVQSNMPFSFTTHVGPIWNNNDAAGKSNAWLDSNSLSHIYKFSGSWETPSDEFNQNSIATFVKINETCKLPFHFILSSNNI